MNENTTLDHEHRISILEQAVKEICINHLPHIQEDIKYIKGLLTRLLVGVLLAGLGVILDLAFRR